MDKSWEARLEFKGSIKISDLLWKHMKKDDKSIVEQLNFCKKFNSRLLKISQEFDLVTIEIKYLFDSKTLFVKILPYAGTYIWVKIPPAHFEVPLKAQELQCIYQIVALFITDFERSMNI